MMTMSKRREALIRAVITRSFESASERVKKSLIHSSDIIKRQVYSDMFAARQDALKWITTAIECDMRNAVSPQDICK